MSQHRDNIKILRNSIKKYPLSLDAVIDTFYEMVSVAEWDSGEIVDMLHEAKGISTQADLILDKYISIEIQFRDED